MEFNDPNVQHKIQMIKENHEKLQNENWHNLKTYVKNFIKQKDVSYTDFIRVIKNLNKPEHTANKLFKLISLF